MNIDKIKKNDQAWSDLLSIIDSHLDGAPGLADGEGELVKRDLLSKFDRYILHKSRYFQESMAKYLRDVKLRPGLWRSLVIWYAKYCRSEQNIKGIELINLPDPVISDKSTSVEEIITTNIHNDGDRYAILSLVKTKPIDNMALVQLCAQLQSSGKSSPDLFPKLMEVVQRKSIVDNESSGSGNVIEDDNDTRSMTLSVGDSIDDAVKKRIRNIPSTEVDDIVELPLVAKTIESLYENKKTKKRTIHQILVGIGEPMSFSDLLSECAAVDPVINATQIITVLRSLARGDDLESGWGLKVVYDSEEEPMFQSITLTQGK